MIRIFSVPTIRLKIFLTLLSVALLPLVCVFVWNTQQLTEVLKEGAYRSLSSSAGQVAAKMDTFLERALQDVTDAAQLPLWGAHVTDSPTTGVGVRSDDDNRAVVTKLAAMHASGGSFVHSCGFVDEHGVTICDTDETAIGRTYATRSWYQHVIETSLPYISGVEFENGQPYLHFSSVVRDAQGQIHGVLRMTYAASVLQRILVQNLDLGGAYSYPLLFDEYHSLLAHGQLAMGTESAHLYEYTHALNAHERAACERRHHITDAAYRDNDGHTLSDYSVEPQFGMMNLGTALRTMSTQKDLYGRAVHQREDLFLRAQLDGSDQPHSAFSYMYVTDKRWIVLYCQSEDVFLQPMVQHMRGAVVTAIIVFIGVLLVSMVASRLIAAPIVSLGALVKHIGAGDFSLRARHVSNDEIGELAHSFNEMLDQLQDRDAVLEDRVAERTHELEEQTRELRQANVYKSDFLANMSHELRTPLNSLIVLSELLLKDKWENLRAGQMESLETIHTSAHDLLSMINDLLDLAKVEAGKLDFHNALFELEVMQTHALRLFTPLADTQKIQFIVEVGSLADQTAERKPERIKSIDSFCGDMPRIEQIIRNLLSNAFKFTSAGGCIRLCLAITTESALPGRTLVCTVTDTGIGIAPEKQHMIFESFQQADSSIARSHGGTGLGLSISRALCHSMHGNLSLESEQGVGTSFTLSIPEGVTEEGGESSFRLPSIPSAALSKAIRIAEDVAASTATDTAANALVSINAGETYDLAGTCALMCDDDMRDLFTVSSVCEDQGVELRIAVHLDECLSMLADDADHIAVLIVNIENVGIAGIQKIRQLAAWKRQAIIVFDAADNAENKQRCAAMGIQSYQEKPLVRHLFITEMQRVCAGADYV